MCAATHQTRRGRHDDIEVIHRREKDYDSSPSPTRRRRRDDRDEIVVSHTRKTSRERERDVLVIRDREHHNRDRNDILEEAEYYNRRATASSSIGEAYNGATQDWGLVEVPPGTKRITLEGVGGASQEITWQRYNGARRAKFKTDGDEYGSDADSRDEKPTIGRSYRGPKEKKDKLWTEISKDLVIKDAVEKAGYDYEETEDYFYIFDYLRYVSPQIVVF